MMLRNRIGAELMGMYVKYSRVYLRCEVVCMMLFNRVGTELMGMYFKYLSIQLRCEVVFRMLRADVTCHATSTPCTLTEPLPFT